MVFPQSRETHKVHFVLRTHIVTYIRTRLFTNESEYICSKNKINVVGVTWLRNKHQTNQSREENLTSVILLYLHNLSPNLCTCETSVFVKPMYLQNFSAQTPFIFQASNPYVNIIVSSSKKFVAGFNVDWVSNLLGTVWHFTFSRT